MSGVFRDSFITLPEENLSPPRHGIQCSSLYSVRQHTGLKVTVVEPSFQYNISNATVDEILFLFFDAYNSAWMKRIYAKLLIFNLCAVVK